MKVNFAHLREQGINFAVFDADATIKDDSHRSQLLSELTFRARNSGLRIEKSALAFKEFGRVKFYGTPDLVNFLSRNFYGIRWTHSIDF